MNGPYIIPAQNIIFYDVTKDIKTIGFKKHHGKRKYIVTAIFDIHGMADRKRCASPAEWEVLEVNFNTMKVKLGDRAGNGSKEYTFRLEGKYVHFLNRKIVVA